jgi:hypothetical protein
MSTHLQAQTQNQWADVLQRYGPVAYDSTEISPTNTSMGEMRSPPPAYSTTASRPTMHRRASHATLTQGVRRNTISRPSSLASLATPVIQIRLPTSSSTPSARSRSAQSLSLDENCSRSISLAFDTSASSSGTDDLESPPIETEPEADTATSNPSIRGSLSSRPSMRHFPSVNSMRNRQSSGDSEEDDDNETYPPRMLCRDDLIGKPVSRKYMTARPSKAKGTLKFDGWWNTSGRKGSRLMSKLKSSGNRLSRLFSSEGESGGSSDGLEEDPVSRTNTRAGAEAQAVEVTRRPSLTIDLSTVPTFTSELLTTSVSASRAEPRVPTPSFVLGRNGFSRYNPLPTIIGSPSIQMSPAEQFYTPSTGLSPVMGSGFPESEGPRSLVGLFQTPLAIPVLTTRSSEATLVNTISAETSKANTPDAMELEKALTRLSTRSITPPLPTANIGLDVGINMGLGMGMDIDMDPTPVSAPAQESESEIEIQTSSETETETETEVTLSIFSPRVHCKPVLLPVIGSPMCSPLELPTLSSPARGSMFSTSTSGFPSSGLPMISSSASRSHSSTGSIRIKIDGNPNSASLASMAVSMIAAAAATEAEAEKKAEEEEEEDKEPAPAPAPTRSTLTRASVDVNALNNRIPIVLAHRPSLPNTLTTTPTSPPRSAFSPIMGSGSPRTPDSPHFARPDFGPVPTPPSLIANPKSLGDPFPKGVPSSSSRNLAAMASADEMHGLGHLRRRSSGRIIDRYARGPLSPPRRMSPSDLQLQSSSVAETLAESDIKSTTTPANPYFA